MDWNNNSEIKYADITQPKYFAILEHFKILAKREERCWDFLRMQFLYLAGCIFHHSSRSFCLISIVFF